MSFDPGPWQETRQPQGRGSRRVAIAGWYLQLAGSARIRY